MRRPQPRRPPGVTRDGAGAVTAPARARPAVVSTNGAEEALDQIPALAAQPTAIMCVNDLVALGVMRCLRKRGIKVPDDMAVVGYDDVPFAAELSTSLTTVRQPTYQLGYTAAALLLADADGASDHQQVVFQPELVVRESA